MSSLLPVLQILEHMQGGRRVNRRYARRSEDTEQMSVMDWARWNQNVHPELELLHHCPNGGSRNKAEAVKLKQMGVKAGIPDLCLPVPMGVYSGLYIEMKYDTGRLEDGQKKMLKALAAAGHYCTVCYGAEEAIRVLEEYINLKKIDTGNREDTMSEQNMMIRKNGKVKMYYFQRVEERSKQARKALKNCELAQRQKKFGFKEAVISSRGECTGCRNPDDGTLDRKCKRCQYNEYYEAK